MQFSESYTSQMSNFNRFRGCSVKVNQRCFRLGSLLLSVCATLSACGVAPGMRMVQPAVVPVTSGDATLRDTIIQIPITDINLTLVRELQLKAAKAPLEQFEGARSAAMPYTIGRGDVLQITVWDHPELALAQGAQPQTVTQRAADPGAGFVVDQSGNLQFPFAGQLHVEGLRTEEVQNKLTEALTEAFSDPQVTVRIASYRSKQIYIDGEVRAPGVQLLNDVPMNLYEAINRAGGFSPSADQSRLVLVRKSISYRVDFAKMLEQGQNPADILLQQGDLLRVLSRDESGVFVMGEVNKPTIAIPMQNGKITLSEALAQAGSLNTSTSDPHQIYVVRGSSDSNLQVFHLDAKSPVSMVLANQFDLQPKDVVYIDGNGLVRFNRILSLLIPAINAGLTAAIATK